MKQVLVILCGLALMSFSGGKGTKTFGYPLNPNARFTMAADQFPKFTEEWRGMDYYYYCEKSPDGIICSVLFYRLNSDEQKLMVEPFGDSAGAGIPFAYFSENSQLKPYERNKSAWGNMTDEFMFRQNDILEFEGIKLKQKHMYGYGLFGKDLFVNVHLSKTDYTSEDSTIMRQILASLVKQK